MEICPETEGIAPALADHNQFITPDEHARRISWAQDRFTDITGSDEWQHAVAPRTPSATMSVYVVTPEQTTAAAHFRRMGVDALNDLEFARKDGDDPDETAAKYEKYAANDIRIAVVDHGENDRSEMVSAMRLLRYTPETSSPAIDAIATEWHQDPKQALATAKLPTGGTAVSLLEHPGVYDVTLASTANHWTVGTNRRGSQALMALYKAALAIINSRGGQYIIGAMDVDGIFKQVSGRGSNSWVDVFPDDHRTILSSVPNSNISTFAICDTFKWRWDIQHTPARRFRYGMLWGIDLDGRGVDFHGLDNRLDVDQPGSQLLPVTDFKYFF